MKINWPELRLPPINLWRVTPMSRMIYGHTPPFHSDLEETRAVGAFDPLVPCTYPDKTIGQLLQERINKDNMDSKKDFRDRCNALHETVKTGIDATLAERETRYGDYPAKCMLIQELKETMRVSSGWSGLRPDMKESLEMIQHKIGRILTGDPYYHDSWHDIVGYAKLVADRLEKK